MTVLANAYPEPPGLIRACAAAMDLLKRNSLSEHTDAGKPMLLKRRNPLGAGMATLANFYFRLAGIPLQFWRDPASWQRWEVSCYHLLHRGVEVHSVGDRSLCMERLPGVDLWTHLERGTLTRTQIRAAGRELWRSHRLPSAAFSGPWSHGDATMSNFLYDPHTRRARLIDFELMHHPHLAAAARHADDLLTFLLDLVSGVPARRWMPLASSFLHAYGGRAAIAALLPRLTVPRGLPRLWWNVRVNFAPTRKIARRLAALRAALQAGNVMTPAVELEPEPGGFPEDAR